MIVLHSRNPSVDSTSTALPYEPPVCLLVPETDEVPAAFIGKLAEQPYIFELAGRQYSVLDTLRSVILTLADANQIGPGPLIFLGQTADPALLTRRVGAQDLRWGLTDQGDLDWLICGTKVVQADLFSTFFRNMAPMMAAEHTQKSLELFNHFFGKSDA